MVVKTLTQVHLTIEFALERGGERMECAFADLACALFPLGTLENVSIRVAQRTISFTDGRGRAASQGRVAAPDQSRRLPPRNIAGGVGTGPEGIEIRRPSLPSLVEYALSRPGLRTLDVEVAGVSVNDVAYLERAAALRAGDDCQEHPRVRAGLRWLTFARDGYRCSILLPRDIVSREH